MPGCLAFIVDLLIVIPAGVILLWIVESAVGNLGILELAVWIPLWVVYYKGWRGSPRGATPGEMALGIEKEQRYTKDEFGPFKR